MPYIGNYTEDYATLNHKFTTRDATGVPTDPVGLAVAVYTGSATGTESTAGVTLAATGNFDSITGLNNLLIDLSADAFYAVGADYHVVVTAGTVDGVSVVGEVVCTFSIENRFEEADITKIKGTALTETGSGYLAGSFKKFFDIQTPAGTVNLIAASGNWNTVTPDAAGTMATALGLLETHGDGAWATATSTAVSDKTGFKLASDGLAAVTAWTVNLTGNLSGSVGSIGAGGIVAASFAADAIAAAAIATGAFTADAFAADAIVAATFATGAFTADAFAADALVAATFATGAFTADAFAANALVAATFATDAIAAGAVSAAAVTKIQSGLATTGEDSDTLETLSDQLDTIATMGNITVAINPFTVST